MGLFEDCQAAKAVEGNEIRQLKAELAKLKANLDK